MDFIDEQVDANNSRDLERFIATCSSDIVIGDGQGNVLMKGHDQLRDVAGDIAAQCEGDAGTKMA